MIPSSTTQNVASCSNSQAVLAQGHDIASCSNSQAVLAQEHNISDQWLSRKRDAIMVVASLIATMAYQAGTNPPGGVFPVNKEAESIGASFHSSNVAGKTVMAYTHPQLYKYFIYTSSTALVASLSTILLLIGGLPLKKKIFTWASMITMWLAITSLAITYGISVYVIMPEKDIKELSPIIEVVVALWCSLIGLLFIGNTFQIAYKWITKMRDKEAEIGITSI